MRLRWYVRYIRISFHSFQKSFALLEIAFFVRWWKEKGSQTTLDYFKSKTQLCDPFDIKLFIQAFIQEGRGLGVFQSGSLFEDSQIYSMNSNSHTSWWADGAGNRCIHSPTTPSWNLRDKALLRQSREVTPELPNSSLVLISAMDESARSVFCESSSKRKANVLIAKIVSSGQMWQLVFAFSLHVSTSIGESDSLFSSAFAAAL